MLLFLGVYLFWIMLRGELSAYAGFATTTNPNGRLGNISLLQLLGVSPQSQSTASPTLLTPGGLPQNDPYLPGYTAPRA